MAITGSGTQLDPYIVHDYEEIKTACYNSGSYVRLANNIDCLADYGADFKWENVPFNCAEFDLNGYTITNVSVKQNNSIFTGAFHDVRIIRNGNFLNVHCDEINNGNDTLTFLQVYLEDMSVSMDLTNTDYEITSTGCSRRCTFYLIWSNVRTRALLATNTNGRWGCVEDSDIYMNGAIASDALPIIWCLDGNTIKNVRLTGEIRNVSAGKTNVICSGNMYDCVIDVDILDNAGNTVTVGSLAPSTSIYTAYNSDKISVTTQTGLIACTTAEIKSGSSLRNGGFVVFDENTTNFYMYRSNASEYFNEDVIESINNNNTFSVLWWPQYPSTVSLYISHAFATDEDDDYLYEIYYVSTNAAYRITSSAIATNFVCPVRYKKTQAGDADDIRFHPMTLSDYNSVFGGNLKNGSIYTWHGNNDQAKNYYWHEYVGLNPLSWIIKNNNTLPYEQAFPPMIPYVPPTPPGASDIYVGDTNILSIYLGDNPVSKIYLGDQEIYS